MKIKEITDYTLFDTETTGLDINYDRMIEIGCIRVRGDVIVDQLRLLVNQPVTSCPEALKKHGHTPEKLAKEGIEPFEACKQALEFMGNDIILGLNSIPYDYPLLEVECNRFKLPRPNLERWADVGLLAKGMFIGYHYNEQELFYKYAWRVKDTRVKGVKYNLDYLAKHYGVQNLRENDIHGAIPDLKMTKNVFDVIKKQLKEYEKK